YSMSDRYGGANKENTGDQDPGHAEVQFGEERGGQDALCNLDGALRHARGWSRPDDRKRAGSLGGHLNTGGRERDRRKRTARQKQARKASREHQAALG